MKKEENKKDKILDALNNMVDAIVIILYKDIEINVYLYPDGTTYWYKNGKFHREDGPAIVYSDGTMHWYFNNIKYPEEEWRQIIENQKRKQKR